MFCFELEVRKEEKIALVWINLTVGTEVEPLSQHKESG